MSEVLKDLDDLEIGYFWETMIEEVAIESEKPITHVIKYLAYCYSTSTQAIYDSLTLINSKFIQNNPPLIYIDRYPISRTGIWYHEKKIIKKLKNKLNLFLMDDINECSNSDIILIAIMNYFNGVETTIEDIVKLEKKDSCLQNIDKKNLPLSFKD